MSQVQHVGVVSHGAIKIDTSRGVDVGHAVAAMKDPLAQEERIKNAVGAVVGAHYIDPLAAIDVCLAL